MTPVCAITICSREFKSFPGPLCGKGLILALPSGIQIYFSPAGPETGLMAIIVQSYCILLAMLFSINHQQLSLFDADHALLLVSSPLMIDVVAASIKDLFGFRDGLIRRVKFHPHIIRALGVLILPIWFGLTLTIQLSSRAFIDSELCSNHTPEDWSELLIWGVLADIDFYAVGLLLVGALYLLRRLIWALTLRVTKRFRVQEGTSGSQGAPRTSVERTWYISVVLGA